MFGQEKYSKKEHGEREKDLEFEREMQSRNKFYSLASLYAGRIRRAYKALDDMVAAGKKEAEGLNREYDRLRGQTEAAMRAQETFEREKLGMHRAENQTEAAA